MPRALGEGALLTVAGHPPVNEPRIARSDVLGAQAQSLGDAGPESLDQRVGLFAELEDEVAAGRVLQVDCDRVARTIEQVPRDVGRGVRGGALEAQDVGAEVREQHARERTGTDARQLEHLQALQRSTHDVTFLEILLPPSPTRDRGRGHPYR